ncbi:MAG: putative zinc-binding metallopeptidase [Rhodospirillales bacterium]
MKIFMCPVCGEDLFFNNLACSCGVDVAYDLQSQSFVYVGRHCANRNNIECNWLASTDVDLCDSCRMTTVHPDLAVPDNTLLWAKAERYKRWALVGLHRWGWFDALDTGGRPEFHMLSEATSTGLTDVTMGHASGLVTINLAEADDVERVRRREEHGEPYRTMIGHFRHEIAHFLFERLAVSDDFHKSFRALFGDETKDYGAALAQHYEAGPPAAWQSAYISAYASAHPHEDWAEIAAHALHLADMVDSFTAAQLSLPVASEPEYDAYAEDDASRLLGIGLGVGIALNHVNRAMGVPDLYPFVTPPMVINKLEFAHSWLKAAPRCKPVQSAK